MTDLTTWTPAEVDTALAEVQERMQPVLDRRWHAIDDIADAKALLRAIDVGRYRGYRSREELDRDIERARAVLDRADEELAALHEEARPYNEEFTRRGGWTRAWLVDNTGGHVHKTRDCSTCFERTRFGWLPQVSGFTEDEIVALAGEGACTVCYPTAPAEVLNNPMALELPKRREERLAREAERDARHAAKVAKSLSLDGSVVEVRWDYQSTSARTGEPYTAHGFKDLKTYRAAELFVVEQLSFPRHASVTVSYDVAPTDTVERVIELMAAKKGVPVEEIRAPLVAKADKKRKASTW